MTKEQFNELYRKVYDAYADSALKDEYVRSTLGDALDHLVAYNEQKKKAQRV